MDGKGKGREQLSMTLLTCFILFSSKWFHLIVDRIKLPLKQLGNKRKQRDENKHCNQRVKVNTSERNNQKEGDSDNWKD